MESRTISRAGTRLHGLWRPGRGSPILVVPGAMAGAREFVPTVEAFGRPEPVLILDRRGREPSGDLGPGYGVGVEVADLRAWIDELGEPVRVVGWSYGATIAVETAAVDPRVLGVVGYDPVLAPFGAAALPALRAADPERRVEIINLDISGYPRARLRTLRAAPELWAQLCRFADPLAEELAALNRFEPDPAWAGVPADLILGEHNQGTEPYGTAFAEVAARLPASRTTVLPGRGHLAHAEDPATLGRLIAGLLGDRVNGPRPARPAGAAGA